MVAKKLANKVMNIQQWMKEVKVLASVTRFDATDMSSASPTERAEEQAAVEGRYATLKELLARREELETPLEEEDAEEEEQVNKAPSRRGGGKKGTKRGKTKGGKAGGNGNGNGNGGRAAGENNVIAGMEGVYAEASEILKEVDDEAEAVETAVDTWFDEHTVRAWYL